MSKEITLALVKDKALSLSFTSQPAGVAQIAKVVVGEQGPPLSSIGDIPIAVSDLSHGDVLMYDGSSWTNENQRNISDGGNF